MVNKALLEQALQLPNDERLELADALRESVGFRDSELTDAIREILDDAQRDTQEHPDDERPWAQTRGELFPHLA